MINEFMFCPKCGKGEQNANNYCRQCGEFLPSLTKKKIRKSVGGDTPEEQIRTNLILNLLSAVVSLALAISLYVTIAGKGAPPVIYLTAAFLVAMSGWQFTTCFIGLRLRKNFQKRREFASENQTDLPNQFESAKTIELLPESDFENAVPPSIVENTTKILDKIPRK